MSDTHWLDPEGFIVWIDVPERRAASDWETKPPQQPIRWKLAPPSGEWELTLRVTLPKKDHEDTQQERDET